MERGSWWRKSSRAGGLQGGEKVKGSGRKRRVGLLLQQRQWRGARLESNVSVIGNDKSAQGKLHSDECLNIVLCKYTSE